jgi:hypothetical protein
MYPQCRTSRLVKFKNRKQIHGVWRWPSLEGLFMDVRYGIRVLRKNRGFTIEAIASLALAIGANTAIFSLLNGLALRDLPVAAAGATGTFRRAKWGRTLRRFVVAPVRADQQRPEGVLFHLRMVGRQPFHRRG